jgi:type IV pilus assembly protein PilW
MKTIHRTPAARGFTLMELLIAVTIGMGLTLAITVMLMRNEAGRRALTSINDVSSNGTYLSYALDRTLRSAGSGFTQFGRQAFGCPLRVARGGATVLPAPSAFPAPFAAVNATIRLAPVVVQAGAGTDGSDVLIVSAGASGLGETPQRVLPGSATGTNLRLNSTVGLAADDLMLLAQNGDTCMLQQVASGFAGGADQLLSFGGTYAASTVAGVPLTDIASTSVGWAMSLGRLSGKRPAFQLIGVGANSTLVAYDLLQLDGNDRLIPLADGVVDLRARYGIDSDDDGRVDQWVLPTTAPWNAATLLDGTPDSQLNLTRIVAVRIGLVLRNSTPERSDVTAGSLTLFGDLAVGLQHTHTVASGDRTLRYRTLDFTVPLRNVLLIPRL